MKHGLISKCSAGQSGAPEQALMTIQANGDSASAPDRERMWHDWQSHFLETKILYNTVRCKHALFNNNSVWPKFSWSYDSIILFEKWTLHFLFEKWTFQFSFVKLSVHFSKRIMESYDHGVSRYIQLFENSYRAKPIITLLFSEFLLPVVWYFCFHLSCLLFSLTQWPLLFTKRYLSFLSSFFFSVFTTLNQGSIFLSCFSSLQLFL